MLLKKTKQKNNYHRHYFDTGKQHMNQQLTLSCLNHLNITASGMKCFALQIPALLSLITTQPTFCAPPQHEPVHNKTQTLPPAPIASSRPSNIYAVAGLPHSPRGQEGSGAGVADCRA